MRGGSVVGVALVAVAVMLGIVLGAGAQAASSGQVVFHAQTPPATTTGTLPSVLGFWIWCEAESLNPYLGLCNGAMYFLPAVYPAVGVSGTVRECLTPCTLSGGSTVSGEGLYQMTVASAGPSVACTLTNLQPATSGPTNTVDLKCAAPPGSGTVQNSGVQVT